MTRTLAPLYLAAGMVAGLYVPHATKVTPSQSMEADGQSMSRSSRGGWQESPAQLSEGGAKPPNILSQLDALDARIAALAYPDPRHCDDACLTGVERVELRRGVVSCRCRRLPSLGVHKIPEVVQR